MNLRHLAGIHNVGEQRLRVRQLQVFKHRAGEQQGLLRHHAQLIAQFIGGELADVARVDFEAPLAWHVKPLDQFRQRALAGA